MAASSDWASTFVSSARLVVESCSRCSSRRRCAARIASPRTITEPVDSRYTASATTSLKLNEGPTNGWPPRKIIPAANQPTIAAARAGAQPAYHTVNATAVNIVASGNDAPIHGVNAMRARIAAATATRATPYFEIVAVVGDINRVRLRDQQI